MNLHNIAAPYIAAVNPWLTASLQQSTGYVTQPDGTRTPAYGAPVAIQVQCQSLQYRDILQIDGLAMEGVRQAIYLNGDWAALVRADKKGGDLITLPDGSVWLCATVLERWFLTSDWVKICATLQDGK